jgi:hypothetical protein
VGVPGHHQVVAQGGQLRGRIWRVDNGQPEHAAPGPVGHPDVGPVDVRIVQADDLHAEAVRPSLVLAVLEMHPAVPLQQSDQVGRPTASPEGAPGVPVGGEVPEPVDRTGGVEVVRAEDEHRRHPPPHRTERLGHELDRGWITEGVAGQYRDVGPGERRQERGRPSVRLGEVEIGEMQHREAGSAGR